MTKRRRRVVAAAIVGLAIAAGVVAADVGVVPQTGATGSAAANVPLRVIASLRNPGATPLTVTMVKRADPGCATITVAPLDGAMMFPVTLQAYKQVQIVVTTTGLAASASCVIDVTGTPGAPKTFQASFTIGSGGIVDLQPDAMDMLAPRGGSETQMFSVMNYQPTVSPMLTATITSSNAAAISFTSGPGCTGSTCTIGAIASKAIITKNVTCSPQAGAATASGRVDIAQMGGSAIETFLVTCSTSGSYVQIDDKPVVIATTVNQLGMKAVGISMTAGMSDDAIGHLLITGPEASYFSFPDFNCMPKNDCDLASATISVPYNLNVGCTPDSLVMRSATLVVTGITDGSDNDTATVQCNPTGGPVLQANPPTTLTIAPDPAVGVASVAQPLKLTNIGTGILDVELSVPAEFVGEWIIPTCTHAAPCHLNGTGATTTVNIQLEAAMHGARDTTLTIATNESPPNQTHSIALVGTAHGAFVEVLEPADTTFSFGTIPSSQIGQQTVKLVDTGNDPVVVTIVSPSAPFGADTTMLSLVPGVPKMFTATCQGATFDGAGDYMLTSTAYNAPTVLHASCKIVDTPITIDPLRFDFGELRIGAPAIEIPFHIANPTTTDVVIADLAIANGPDVLELDAMATTMTVHGGEMLDGKIRLLSTAETVIADDVALEFTADGTMLSLPITGRVVTPHAKVDPIALDLGTACVGSPATGTIRMINDGTATLVAEMPTLDTMAFVTHDTVAYPAMLRAATELGVDVEPATTAAGSLHGTLTWAVDSGLPFKVPIDIDYIEAGAAVSPERYDFATVDVGASSDRRVVTLENCNADPLRVTIAGVVPRAGDADAWDVQPRNEQRVLGPHESIKVTVRFVPKHRGHHEASISILAGTQPIDVQLIAEAKGPPDATSFYACSCDSSTGGLPVGGAPIVFALFAIRRRRR